MTGLQVWKWKLHWQVLAGIVLGLCTGVLVHLIAPGDSIFLEALVFTGTIFMSALKMLIIPLVCSSIISSMAGLGQHGGFARLGVKTLIYYMFTSLFAILIGLTLVNWIQPGISVGISPEQAAEMVAVKNSPEAINMAYLKAKTDGKGTDSLLGVFYAMFPSNIADAAAKGNMLGLIVFSLLFGFFVSRLPDAQREGLAGVLDAIYQVMMKMTMFIMAFLPLGVFALIARVSAETMASGHVTERILQLLWFALTVLMALALHLFLVLPCLLYFVARVSPARFFSSISQAMLTAFSTASSSATLPVTMECLQDNAGVSKRVTSMVLPLGATVNMDGTALYECVVVIFLAQFCGVHLDLSLQFQVVVLALLTSIGVAGIPAASLVAIMLILNAVNANLPTAQQISVHALPVILIFDRLLDMCRTAVNVTGDACGAVLIARTEGEETSIGR